MSTTINEQIINKSHELQEEFGPIIYDEDFDVLAKHCLAAELRAEIIGICFCYPDLNSDSGITIQSGSRKEFALQRKIELEKQLSELEKGT